MKQNYALGQIVALAEKGARIKGGSLSASQYDKAIYTPMAIMPFLIKEFIKPFKQLDFRLAKIMEHVNEFPDYLTISEGANAQLGYYHEMYKKETNG